MYSICVTGFSFLLSDVLESTFISILRSVSLSCSLRSQPSRLLSFQLDLEPTLTTLLASSPSTPRELHVVERLQRRSEHLRVCEQRIFSDVTPGRLDCSSKLDSAWSSDGLPSSVASLDFNNLFNSVLTGGDRTDTFIKLIVLGSTDQQYLDVLFDVISFVLRSVNSVRSKDSSTCYRSLEFQCGVCEVALGDLVECDVTMTSSCDAAAVVVRKQSHGVVMRLVLFS